MSLAPSIEAFAFDFKFYIFPYVLHLIPFVDHLIPSVCDVPSLPICLICNAPLCCIFVESVLQVCKSRCLAPLICVFDLHLWVLCLVLRFALHFFVHRFLHLGLAHWFTFSCTSILITSRTSIASSPCSWNPFLWHLELVCLPYVLHHQLLCLSLVLSLCLASLIFFICTADSKCLPLYLASLSFTFVLLFQHLFCTFGLHVLNLRSMCFIIILHLWMLSSNTYTILSAVIVVHVNMLTLSKLLWRSVELLRKLTSLKWR